MTSDRRDTDRSADAFARASSVMPGGVSSPVRAHAAVGGTPRFVARGEGAWLWDIDGAKYLDLSGSWGPLILGHAHPAVVDAIARAARDGTSFGAPTERETALATVLCDAFPSIEQVRLVSSGTEAAMSAVRLARAATGRDTIIKFTGCYHGHADGLLASAGSGALTQGLPDSPGVTAGAARDTLVVAYNELDAVRAACTGGAVAAIIVEPVAGNMGVVLPDPGFLEGLRDIADTHGTLLIFDEVITGFRVAWGGVQTLTGITPDLTVLGKIIGGGMPLAAYGGRRDLMSRMAPVGPVYQAGTLSGNPVSVAAGLATLDTLRREDPYAALDAGGARVEAALQALPGVCVQRAGSMFTAFFTEEPVRNLADAKATDVERFAPWFHRLLDAGVWWPPSPFEAAFLSVPLLDELEELLARIAQTA